MSAYEHNLDPIEVVGEKVGFGVGMVIFVSMLTFMANKSGFLSFSPLYAGGLIAAVYTLYQIMYGKKHE